MQRLDEPLRLSCVPDRLARLSDTGIQRCFTDKLLGPQVVEDLLPGYDAVAMGNEIDEDVEHLRAELDQRPVRRNSQRLVSSV